MHEEVSDPLASPTLGLAAVARSAGIAVVAAALALGVRLYDQGQEEKIWLFILGVTTLATFGFLIIAVAERIHPSMFAVAVGRSLVAAGVLSVLASLALSIKLTTEASIDEAWTFIASLTMFSPPLLGVLLVLTALPPLDDRLLGRTSYPALALGVASALGAVAYTIRTVSDGNTDNSAWVILSLATAPVAASLILISAARPSEPSGFRPIAMATCGLSLACLVSTIAFGLWFVDQVDGPGSFWLFLGVSTLALSIGFLALTASGALPSNPAPALGGALLVVAAIAFAIKLTGDDSFQYLTAFLTGSAFGASSTTALTVRGGSSDAWMILGVSAMPVAVVLLQMVLSVGLAVQRPASHGLEADTLAEAEPVETPEPQPEPITRPSDPEPDLSVWAKREPGS